MEKVEKRLTFNQERLLDLAVLKYEKAIGGLIEKAKDADSMSTASSKLSTNLDFKKAAEVIGDNFIKLCKKEGIYTPALDKAVLQIKQQFLSEIVAGQPRSAVRYTLKICQESLSYWVSMFRSHS